MTQTMVVYSDNPQVDTCVCYGHHVKTLDKILNVSYAVSFMSMIGLAFSVITIMAAFICKIEPHWWWLTFPTLFLMLTVLPLWLEWTTRQGVFSRTSKNPAAMAMLQRFGSVIDDPIDLISALDTMAETFGEKSTMMMAALFADEDRCEDAMVLLRTFAATENPATVATTGDVLQELWDITVKKELDAEQEWLRVEQERAETELAVRRAQPDYSDELRKLTKLATVSVVDKEDE